MEPLWKAAVSFKRPKRNSADLDQRQASQTHGAGWLSRKGGHFLKSSHYKKDRFFIWHLLQPSNIEQVVLSRDNDLL